MAQTVRVHVDDAGTVSCDFARKIQGDVNTALAGAPQKTSFSFSETSAREPSKQYVVNCERANHLSRCAVTGSAPHNYVLYVQDAVN